MPGKKRVGPFRLPQEPLDREPQAQKTKIGDSRVVLARRAKKHLRDVAAGRVVVEDPDSEVRQSPRPPQFPNVKRSFLGASTVEADDDEE
jgi:hypothetical protein